MESLEGRTWEKFSCTVEYESGKWHLSPESVLHEMGFRIFSPAIKSVYPYISSAFFSHYFRVSGRFCERWPIIRIPPFSWCGRQPPPACRLVRFALRGRSHDLRLRVASAEAACAESLQRERWFADVRRGGDIQKCDFAQRFSNGDGSQIRPRREGSATEGDTCSSSSSLQPAWHCPYWREERSCTAASRARRTTA